MPRGKTNKNSKEIGVVNGDLPRSGGTRRICLHPILQPVYSMYIARHFVQVVRGVDHTCRSVALVSFQLYNSVYVLVISKLSGVRASGLLKRKCIRLLFLSVHRISPDKRTRTCTFRVIL